MKSYLFVALISWSICLLCSCEVDQDVELPVFYWEQTSCADPWAKTPYNSKELKSAVLSYLSDQGISTARFLLLSSDGIQQVCMACTCTTGNRIWIQVPAGYEEKLLTLGFVKNP